MDNEAKIQAVTHRIEERVRTDWLSERDNFNESVSVNRLAEEACMSVRNLQLMFKSHMKMPLHKYIVLRRLEYAQQLMRYRSMTLTQIADHLGYANPQALTNKFTKEFGITPSQRLSEVTHSRWADTSTISVGTPRPEQLPRTAVLFLSYIGQYDQLTSAEFEQESWDRIEEYAREHGLLSEGTQYWGIAFDDTDITQPDECRFYAAVSIRDDQSIRIPQSEWIQRMYLPEGRYLVYTHRGAYEHLDKFYEAAFRALPCPMGDGYILERYLNSAENIRTEDLITEVWIPISSQ